MKKVHICDSCRKQPHKIILTYSPLDSRGFYGILEMNVFFSKYRILGTHFTELFLMTSWQQFKMANALF